MHKINDEVFILDQGIIRKGTVIGTQQTVVRGCSVTSHVLLDLPTNHCNNVNRRPPLEVFRDYASNVWDANHVFSSINDLIDYLKESYLIANGIKTNT
jgi:hypothetical protein